MEALVNPAVLRTPEVPRSTAVERRGQAAYARRKARYEEAARLLRCPESSASPPTTAGYHLAESLVQTGDAPQRRLFKIKVELKSAQAATPEEQMMMMRMGRVRAA